MAADLNPQTQRARVTIFLNGAPANSGKLLTFDFLHATWEDLLATAQAKLGAEKPFKRVFVQNGAEAESLGDIFPGDDLYFSFGEAFIPPTSADQPSASSSAAAAPSSSSSSSSPAAVTVSVPETATGDEKAAAPVSLVTRSAQAVASAAEKLYTESAEFVKARGPTVVKVTLERVEDSVGAIKPQIVERLLQVTQWADEKLDNAYQSLNRRKSEFLSSPVGQQANQYFNASALGVQSLVIEPSQAFLQTAAVKFHQLQGASQDGKVAVESFVASLKEHLGAAWNDKLVEPAKAAHEAISNQVAARLQQVGDNKTVQQVREITSQLAADGNAQLQAAKERLGRAWSDVVVANFQSKVVAPADTFYQLALNNYMQLRASGNGRVTLNEFVAALRATTGRLWNDHLLPPAQHLYNNFTLAAAHVRDAASHSREVPSNSDENNQAAGGQGAAGSQ